jgi:hypothetical protein
MHLIGHIPDGDRSHDVGLPGVLGLIAFYRNAGIATMEDPSSQVSHVEPDS